MWWQRFLSTPHIHNISLKSTKQSGKNHKIRPAGKKVLLCESTVLCHTNVMQSHRNGEEKLTKGGTEPKTQSEEDGSSASSPLIAQDRLRLANYALWSIHHRPINHGNTTPLQQRYSPNWRSPQHGHVGEIYNFSSGLNKPTRTTGLGLTWGSWVQAWGKWCTATKSPAGW